MTEATVDALLLLVEELYSQKFRELKMTPEATTSFFDDMQHQWQKRVAQNRRLLEVDSATRASMIHIGGLAIDRVRDYVSLQTAANDDG
jgi:hypothetical protein